MLKRDPDNGNARPIGEGAQMPRRPRTRRVAGSCGREGADHDGARAALRPLGQPRDPGAAHLGLPKVAIVTVDSQHDVADQAPDALIAHVRKFTATT